MELEIKVKIKKASTNLGQTLNSNTFPEVNAATRTKEFLLHWRGRIALNSDDHTVKRYLSRSKVSSVK